MTTKLGPVILDIEGTDLLPEDVELMQNPWVGGVILFSRNYLNREQLMRLVAEIRAANSALLICVDHEGGRVQRFREGFTRIPAMQIFGRLFEQEPAEALHAAHETAWLLSSELLACGLDLSFAPVLDIDDSFSTIIGDRSFSPAPSVAIALARSFINGMHDAGMAATGKHFPGHGGVAADSHLELPIDSRSLAELEARDLMPFRELSDELDGVMPAHILFPAVDPQPVGFSQYWLKNKLKQDLGFNGVIFSDDLSMQGALGAGTYTERAVAALQAGCTSVLVCNNRPGALEVLSGLTQHYSHRPDSLLEGMKARRNLSWHALESNPRTSAARDLIRSLMA